MPVDENKGCELCDELKQIVSLKNSLNYPDDHSINIILNEIIRNLKPYSTETEYFVNKKSKHLPSQLSIGRLERVCTVELFLLEFYNLLHRGYPVSYLIDTFKDIKEKYYHVYYGSATDNANIEYLMIEILRSFFREWKYITAEWASKKLIKLLDFDFSNGTNIVKYILPEIGRTLANTTTARKGLRLSFQRAIRGLTKLNEDDDPDSEKRWNLYEGCLLFCINYNFFSKQKYFSKYHIDENYEKEIINFLDGVLKKDGLLPDTKIFLHEIWNSIRFARFEDPFIPSLLYVLNNIIRPLRHQHVHLLPYGIKKLMSGKQLTEIQITTIIDRIEEFKLCMSTVLKRLPNKFSEDSIKFTNVMLFYFDKFIEDLKKYKKGADNYEVLKRRVGSLNRIYPKSHSNSLCTDLLKINCSLNDILHNFSVDLLKKHPKISLQTTSFLGEIDNIYILLPNKETFYHSIRNYTIDVQYESNKRPSPEIHITLEEHKNKNLIEILKITIFTNFHDYNKTAERIKAGPGLREMNQRDNQLFHIKTTVKSNETSPDKRMYPVAIIFEIPIGVSVNN